jgi:hypothetical protein
MLCECRNGDCRTVVMIGLEDYHALRRDSGAILTAPGHWAGSRREDHVRSA